MARRRFLTQLLSAGSVGLVAPTLYAFGEAEVLAPPLRPKPILAGQTIGLIAPGYAFPEKVIAETEQVLRNLDFEPYRTERLLQPHGYFSNTDEARAADVMHMFNNPKVDAVLCIRGGYGCTRILELLDYGQIKDNPKPLIGFSDVTALLQAVHKETGLICFHGPVGSTLNDPYTIANFLGMLNPKSGLPSITNATLDSRLANNTVYQRYTITAGTATGLLCGGSLTLINALVGTPHELDFTNKIVCIEDIDEAPYRIDRMLTQLVNGPTFKKAAGIVFGVCKGCDESTNPRSFSLRQVILDRIKPLGIPSVYGMSFGHVKQNFTFPIGAEAALDTEKRQLDITAEYLDR